MGEYAYLKKLIEMDLQFRKEHKILIMNIERHIILLINEALKRLDYEDIFIDFDTIGNLFIINIYHKDKLSFEIQDRLRSIFEISGIVNHSAGSYIYVKGLKN